MSEPDVPAVDDSALQRSEEAIREARAAAAEMHDEGGLVPPDEAQGVQPPG